MSNVDLAKLQRYIKECVDKFNEFKKAGINPELLVIYIQHMTRLNKAEVKAMLKAQDDFYNTLLSKKVMEEL